MYTQSNTKQYHVKLYCMLHTWTAGDGLNKQLETQYKASDPIIQTLDGLTDCC